MPNLRILYQNHADTAGIFSTSEVGALKTENLKNDRKSSVHRCDGNLVQIYMSWPAPVSIGAVSLPACNLEAGANVNVRLYTGAGWTTQILDLSRQVGYAPGLVGVAPGARSANHFALGGETRHTVWLGQNYTGILGCIIFLQDVANTSGFLDSSRLVVSPYWEAPKNPGYGGSAGVVDTSKAERTDSGDVCISRGAVYRTMSLKLDEFPEANRAELLRIVTSAAGKNLLYSLFPENASASLEHDHTIYGRRASGAFSMDFYNSYSTPLEIEGW